MTDRDDCEEEVLCQSYAVKFRGMILPLSQLCRTDLLAQAWKEYIDGNNNSSKDI